MDFVNQRFNNFFLEYRQRMINAAFKLFTRQDKVGNRTLLYNDLLYLELIGLYGTLIYDEIVTTHPDSNKTIDDFKEEFLWEEFRKHFGSINFNIEELDRLFGLSQLIDFGFSDSQQQIDQVDVPDTFVCGCSMLPQTDTMRVIIDYDPKPVY